MTKQEEIRDWYKDVLSGHGCPDTYLGNETDKLLNYLHSQGVVIKVDGELPPYNYDRTGHKRPASEMVEAMLEAGYVAVEPLIEGG